MTTLKPAKHQSSKSAATPSNTQPVHQPDQLPDIRTLLNAENILSLQRMIGNQAALRMTAPRIQRDLSFDHTQWHDGKEAKRLTSGVNPVYGVDNLVIKGLKSGGAQQEFASQLYGGLVEAPRTRAVPVDSDEGRAIVFLLKRKKLLAKPEKADSDEKGAKRERRLNPEVTVLLVMEKVALRSLEDFAKELENPKDANKSEKENRLRKGSKEMENPSSFDSAIDKIFEANFFFDLGQIHALDIFLGNSDRLDRYGEVAMQNIFINVSNGSYGALGLDLDVEAASLAMVQSSGSTTGSKSKGTQKKYQTSDANKYKNWVLHSIKGADAKREIENTQDPTDKKSLRFGTMNAPGAMDSTDVSALFDPTRIALAVNQFRSSLEKWFPKPPADAHATNERERRGDMIGTPYYQNVLWPQAHAKFEKGIQVGIAAIRDGMKPGGKYEKLYLASVQNSPREDVFDFAVLQIRAKYFELKQDPYHQYTEAEIMTRLEAYAKRLDEGWGKV